MDFLTPSFTDFRSLRELQRASPQIRFVRFQWQDLSGLFRACVVPFERALAIADGTWRLHVSPIAFHCIVDNSRISDLDYTGSHRLIPDWASLRTRERLDTSHASVMCRVVTQAPSRLEPEWNLCPRNALQIVVEKASKMLQAELLVGFEVVFEILKFSAENKPVPHYNGLGRFAVSGMRDPCYTYVEEAVRIMLDAGFTIDAIQTEDHRGQYEIALGPLCPVQAIDQLVLVHDTLKHVFTRHRLMATMSPRPVTTRQQAIGQHTHISISDSALEESFLAGILQRLPQLCAFCLPYELSYECVRPYCAGDVVAWGTENRSVPIRKIKAGHWELRFVDATANMYLALAAIVSAKLIGCAQNEPFRWPDTVSDAQPSPDSSQRLPRSIEEALHALAENSDELETMMESQIIRNYRLVKNFEAAKLCRVDPEETRHLMVEIF